MIRVALIYKPSYEFFQPTCINQVIYNFHFHALKRNKNLQVEYYPANNTFDVDAIKDKTDVILLAEDDISAVPNLENIHKSKIPVISKIDDPHSSEKNNRFVNKEKFNISYYYTSLLSEFFYEYYPRTSKFKSIMIGLEPNLFQNITPFKDRIANKLLNSGHARIYTPKLRIRRWLQRNLKGIERDWTINAHYHLRSQCNKLKYVDYFSKHTTKYVGNKYSELLNKYRASIAATTIFPTIKYLEIPAAGCLTFMEITKFNRGEFLGFKDGQNAIFINEDNYKDKFQEYLSDVDNPKWEEIANNGREYTMNNFNNDIAVEKLVDLMREVIQ